MKRLEVDGMECYAGAFPNTGLVAFYVPDQKDGWHLAGWLRGDGTYRACKGTTLMQKIVAAWKTLTSVN